MFLIIRIYQEWSIDNVLHANRPRHLLQIISVYCWPDWASYDIHFGLFQVPFQDTNFSRKDTSVFPGSPFNCSSTIRGNETELNAYETLIFKVYKMIFYYYCLFKFIIFYPFLKVGRSETGNITMEYSHMKSLQQHSKSPVINPFPVTANSY